MDPDEPSQIRRRNHPNPSKPTPDNTKVAGSGTPDWEELTENTACPVVNPLITLTLSEWLPGPNATWPTLYPFATLFVSFRIEQAMSNAHGFPVPLVVEVVRIKAGPLPVSSNTWNRSPISATSSTNRLPAPVKVQGEVLFVSATGFVVGVQNWLFAGPHPIPATGKPVSVPQVNS